MKYLLSVAAAAGLIGGFFITRTFFVTSNSPKPASNIPLPFSIASAHQRLLQEIRLGIKFIIRNQQQDGSFAYEFFPAIGKWSSDNNYVRQAGAFFTLTQAYCLFGETKWEPAIHQVQRFFASRQKIYHSGGQLEIFLQDRNNQLKTNITALYLLGLTELLDSTCRGELKPDQELATGLANTLLVSQNSDGTFRYLYHQSGSKSDYANGEAFFALVRAYQILGDQKYLLAAIKSGQGLLALYQPERNMSFFSWGIQGFVELNQAVPDKRWSDFVFQQSDQVVAVHADVLDCSSSALSRPCSPHSRSVGVFAEGIAAAARLADQAGDHQRSKNYRRWLNGVVNYLQATRVSAGKFAQPVQSTAQGGFCNDLACQGMRVDFTHHAISALIGMIKLTNISSLTTSLQVATIETNQSLLSLVHYL